MHCYDLIGDCIGMESCSDLSINGDSDLDRRTDFRQQRSGVRDRRRQTESKEFPPPLSILTWTEDSTPWVLRRYHTADGRLILREERVPRQGYFRANRSNGRLTLQFFLLDDAVCEESECDEEEECEDSQEADSFDEEQELVEEGLVMAMEKESAYEEGGAGGVGGKCMDYNSPCFLRMPILPIRTVHT